MFKNEILILINYFNQKKFGIYFYDSYVAIIKK